MPLVVSEYRERKILKRFQVTPVSPAKLLLAEFLIYVIYCIVSMLTLFLAAVQKILCIFPLTQGIQLMKAAFLGLPIENVLHPITVMSAGLRSIREKRRYRTPSACVRSGRSPRGISKISLLFWRRRSEHAVYRYQSATKGSMRLSDRRKMTAMERFGAVI